MTDDDIRVALIGYGLGGAVFHGPLIATTPGMAVKSVVTSNPERQALARARHPEARIVERADALWERAEDHDLVVIVSTNAFHMPLGLAALEAGLPIVVDKPLAASAADAERLLAEARRRDLLFSVFQSRRFDGDFLTVRRLLDDGALGDAVRFESRFERWRPEVEADAWRERAGPEEAGGLLFDLGSHLIDQAMQLFGMVARVYAEVDRRRPGAAVDDDTFVALEHASGVRSHLWMSVLAAILGPRFRVLGRAGAFEKYGLDPQEATLAGGTWPGGEAWGREEPDAWGRLTTGDGERTVETEPGDYPAYYAAVADALRTGGPPPVDPAEAIAALRVIEAALRSARSGSVEAVEGEAP